MILCTHNKALNSMKNFSYSISSSYMFPSTVLYIYKESKIISKAKLILKHQAYCKIKNLLTMNDVL